MIGTDLIALILAPLWAAIKDKVKVSPTWHPWILAGVTGAILAATTALGLGPGAWKDLWWNTVTIVASVFTGYTIAKPVETVGAGKVIKAATPLLLLVIVGFAGVAVADSLDTTSGGGEVGDAIGKSIQLWLGILGGIIARFIRRGK